jgi:hypothetical protein
LKIHGHSIANASTLAKGKTRSISTFKQVQTCHFDFIKVYLIETKKSRISGYGYLESLEAKHGELIWRRK